MEKRLGARSLLPSELPVCAEASFGAEGGGKLPHSKAVANASSFPIPVTQI